MSIFIEVSSDILSLVWGGLPSDGVGVLTLMDCSCRFWFLRTTSGSGNGACSCGHALSSVSWCFGCGWIPAAVGSCAWMCTVEDGLELLRKQDGGLVLLGHSCHHLSVIMEMSCDFWSATSKIDDMAKHWNCPGTSRSSPRYGLRAAKVTGCATVCWQKLMKMPRFTDGFKERFFHRLKTDIAQLQSEMGIKKWDELALSRLHS